MRCPNCCRPMTFTVHDEECGAGHMSVHYGCGQHIDCPTTIITGCSSAEQGCARAFKEMTSRMLEQATPAFGLD